jgi:hypothetical protein
MNVVLWIVAGILAIAFAMGGLLKISQPKDKLAAKWPGSKTSPQGRSRSSEPWECWSPRAHPARGHRHRPDSDPLAAAGLAVIMILAPVVHGRKEPQMIVVNLVLFALVASVAIMRFGPQAF